MVFISFAISSYKFGKCLPNTRNQPIAHFRRVISVASQHCHQVALRSLSPSQMYQIGGNMTTLLPRLSFSAIGMEPALHLMPRQSSSQLQEQCPHKPMAWAKCRRVMPKG